MEMTGEERRLQILNAIKEADAPISGAALAKKYHVSRQIIVQDIARLRAASYDIFSTNRGYMINLPSGLTRTFCVSHTDDEIEDELNSIVDMGGSAVDVFVKHEVYGSLKAPLNISSRRQVKLFVDEIRTGKSSPLKNLTSGLHWHTVEADSEETLDLIEEELARKGYLRSEIK